MALIAKTIETTGIVNAQHQLLLDESLPIAESSQVRVIIIVQKKPETQQLTDYSQALADDVKQALAQLDMLTDSELWQAAQITVSSEKTDAMQILVEKRQREGLTESENQQAQLLSHLFNRVMLVRAKATALLKKRGYDISTLITENE
jgi:hypothetical protein